MKRRKIVFVVMVLGLLLMLASACKSKEPAAETAASAEKEIELLDENTTYEAVIEVENYGTIVFTLRQDAAPVSAANFVSLAKEGFYDGLTFHRIIDGFMIQGGDPNGNGSGGSGRPITGEFKSNGHDNPISHVRGVVSMARAQDPNSGSSQFFIVQTDSTYLDGDYTAFGEVTEGMDVVDQICKEVPVQDGNGTVAAADQPVITSVTIREK
jgi:peptidyl-prolyl cis-trans isomerase B (cyclophilin B)